MNNGYYNEHYTQDFSRQNGPRPGGPGFGPGRPGPGGPRPGPRPPMNQNNRFWGPFILGGITGGLISPFFYGNRPNYYPYPYPYPVYGPYPYYR